MIQNSSNDLESIIFNQITHMNQKILISEIISRWLQITVIKNNLTKILLTLNILMIQRDWKLIQMTKKT